MNDWTLEVQNKQAIRPTIDFSRAFDSVSHDKLFIHLSEYGIASCYVGYKTFLIIVYTRGTGADLRSKASSASDQGGFR